MRRRHLAALCVVAFFVSCKAEVSPLDEVERIAYTVKPAVVRVTSLATAEFSPSRSDLTKLATALKERGVTPGNATPATWVETGAGGSGTGFLIHPDGFLLTSSHVIDSTRDRSALERTLRKNGAIASLLRLAPVEVVRPLYGSDEFQRLVDALAASGSLRGINLVARVELSNGETHNYTLRASSPSFARGGHDLAVLKIERKDLPILRLANSANVHLQEDVWAIGYPAVGSSSDDLLGGWLSSDSDLEATFNPGTITATRKTVARLTVFQSNAAIYPGNSGGPVVNRQGQVIGISSWGHDTAEQIKFLLPVNLARPFLAEAGVRENQESSFNRAYREALEAAADGDWLQTRDRLALANRLFPNSPDLIRFARDADEQVRALPPWRLYPRTATAISLAGAITVAMLIALALRMRKPLHDGIDIANDYYVEPEARDGAMLTTAAAERFESSRPPLGRLTILNGDKAGNRFGLGGSGIRIGRESALCEIVLENPKVSRLHAEVVSIGGRVLLIDRNSSNGTYVNDRKIDRHYLKDGDIIYFGGRNAVAAAFHS